MKILGFLVQCVLVAHSLDLLMHVHHKQFIQGLAMFHFVGLRVHSHRALALVAMLQIGYKPHSLCSVSINANTWCEWCNLTSKYHRRFDANANALCERAHKGPVTLSESDIANRWVAIHTKQCQRSNKKFAFAFAQFEQTLNSSRVKCLQST